MTLALQLKLFGSPQISYQGQPLNGFVSAKVRALLIYLAVTARPHSRDHLAHLLWEDTPASMKPNLRKALSNLRQLLGDLLVEEGKDLIALDAQRYWVDVVAFERALNSGALTEAAQLYTADFLAGFNPSLSYEFEAWTLREQSRLKSGMVDLLRKLATQQETRNTLTEAIGTVRRLLDLEPWQEESHRWLMELLVKNGQRCAALAHFEVCKGILKQELDVEPDEKTYALYKNILAGSLTFDDAKKVFTNRVEKASNLPPQLTSFVGREQEIQAICALLTNPHCRLVNIIGAGGIGKTRLALATAERLLQKYADGIFFVSLTDLNQADYIPGTIAESLHLLTPRGKEDLDRRLMDFLSSKKIMLILDNFEHLPDGASYLTKLLENAPALTLLVTSRERLMLREEWLFPLNGLPYPEKISAEGEASGSAVDLFSQRATQFQPDFATHRQWSEIIHICQLVEGMPLAIELAAAWLRSMSCAEIAAELQRSFDLLATQIKNVEQRHRSIRLVFEYSWQLLTPGEQEMLIRLSIFRNGFTRDAALSVTEHSPAILRTLIDKSMLSRNNTGRLLIHELLRQFVLEKLKLTTDQYEKTCTRHCLYFGKFLADLPSSWYAVSMSEQAHPDTAQKVAAEIHNIRVAWQRAVQLRNVNIIEQMMNGIVQYFYELGFAEGGKLFDEAIAAIRYDDTLPEGNRYRILASLQLRRIWIYNQDNLQEGLQKSAECVALLRLAGADHSPELGHALVCYGVFLGTSGQNADGEAKIHEGIEIFRKTDHTLALGNALIYRGLLLMGWGKVANTEKTLAEAMTYLAPNYRHQSMYAHWLWASTKMMQGDYQLADSGLQEAFQYYQTVNPEHQFIPFILRNRAETLIGKGDWHEAERLFQEATVRFKKSNHEWKVTIGFIYTPGVLAHVRGDVSKADALLSESVAIARKVGFEQRIATTLHHLARLRHDMGEYSAALIHLEEALTIARKIDFRYATTLVLCQLGHTHLSLKNLDDAQIHYVESLQIALNESIDRLVLEVFVGIAQLLRSRTIIEQSAFLLAYVHQHPASDYATRQKADRLLQEWGQQSALASNKQNPALLDLAEDIRKTYLTLGKLTAETLSIA